MGDYKYLFPFEKIMPNSRVIIYGAGNTGVEYIKQILMTKYCDIVGVTDKRAKELPKMIVPLYTLEEVKNLCFDYIVIAMQKPTYNEKIIDDLIKISVPKEKIIFEGCREEIKSIYVNSKELKRNSLAYHKKGISIAIQISSGIGDVIISKKMIKQLLSLSSNVNLDIYCSNDMVPVFYDDKEPINAFVTPQCETFYNAYDNYDIAILNRFYLTFYSFKYDKIKRCDSEFADKMQVLYTAVKKYNDDCAINERIRIFYERAEYMKKSVYCYPNYYADILEIRDSRVYIPVLREWESEFKKLNIKKYITVNCGNGVGYSNISKQWPLENFVQLVRKIKKEYSEFIIVQLGVLDAEKIIDCDEYIMGKDLELVKHILLHSTLHIDIEGGLVHIATQLGTKCVVLFGPTPIKAFGYSQNINIQAGDCHNCCGVESNIYQCARHLDVPECMEAITVDMVYDKVDNYLNEVKKT